MKKSLLVALAGLFVSSLAFAHHNYGMAGCGLGSKWFADDNVTSQVLAATTNGSSYNQLFGISSGSSNCTDHGHVRSAKEATMFIETNQIALANDIARGNGETLAHLSKVLGCSDAQNVGAALQKNYDSIFSTENIKDSKVGESIIGVMKSDTSVKSQCSHLI